MTAKNNKNIIYYILYKRGRARVVSRDEWEKSWLFWYKKNKKKY